MYRKSILIIAILVLVMFSGCSSDTGYSGPVTAEENTAVPAISQGSTTQSPVPSSAPGRPEENTEPPAAPSAVPVSDERDAGEGEFEHVIIYDGMVIFCGEETRHFVDMQSYGYFTSSLSPDRSMIAFMAGEAYAMEYEIIVLDIESMEQSSFNLVMNDSYGLDRMYWKRNDRLYFYGHVNPSVSKFIVTDLEGNIIADTSGMGFILTGSDKLLYRQNNGHFYPREEVSRLLLDDEILYECEKPGTSIEGIVMDPDTGLMAFIEETGDEVILRCGFIDEGQPAITGMLSYDVTDVPNGSLVIRGGVVITGNGSGTFEINIETGETTRGSESISKYGSIPEKIDKREVLDRYMVLDIPDYRLMEVVVFDLRP